MLWEVYVQQFLQQTNILKGRKDTKDLFRIKKVIENDIARDVFSVWMSKS
jgi:hypothetical protein